MLIYAVVYKYLRVMFLSTFALTSPHLAPKHILSLQYISPEHPGKKQNRRKTCRHVGEASDHMVHVSESRVISIGNLNVNKPSLCSELPDQVGYFLSVEAAFGFFWSRG